MPGNKDCDDIDSFLHISPCFFCGEPTEPTDSAPLRNGASAHVACAIQATLDDIAQKESDEQR